VDARRREECTGVGLVAGDVAVGEHPLVNGASAAVSVSATAGPVVSESE